MNRELVQEYYGEILQSSEDLKTSACCDGGGVPAHYRPLLCKLHPEVIAKYYGCGVAVPTALDGASVLDLGSGSGRDSYLIAQLVGQAGRVVGVDMTDAQLATATEHLGWQMEKFGYGEPNVRFLKGYIETLGDLDLEPRSFDVIVSNCVINLSIDKPAVLKGAFDLLKEGGELYFADVYCDRRLPDAVRKDPLLYGECLGGALYWGDFLEMAKRAGFLDPRLVASRPLEVEDAAMREKLGAARFYSATYRLFKIPQFEPSCEDYGQAVIYNGGIAEEPDVFVLDDHHAIARGKVFPVCGNTWHMLKESRFAPYFEFIGDFSNHYGLFEGCGSGIPFSSGGVSAGSGGTGCC
ncbi:arsenite S-adenosylmethyltransferase [Methyloligella halotolerans]|uniref:Arsenite methyltransferase n=1 Tax=Methyloligella halotolerans TaxID=1177755 RepID=A0A1E2RWD9_9HYPH|nr:methyltransferase domain-containing protein [Methyloligella halotolerans]ODA66531.1 arsenite S-adenosylmethyltransferase [Methyloligella halotolerans]